MKYTEIVHKDFTNRILKVGDKVAFVLHDLEEGTVTRFSPKMVEIEYGEVKAWLQRKPKKFVYPHNCVILKQQNDSLISLQGV